MRAAQKIPDVTAIRAVLFDWRGTLVVTPEDEQWVSERSAWLAARPGSRCRSPALIDTSHQRLSHVMRLAC
jgi:hypothetical protein